MKCTPVLSKKLALLATALGLLIRAAMPAVYPVQARENARALPADVPRTSNSSSENKRPSNERIAQMLMGTDTGALKDPSGVLPRVPTLYERAMALDGKEGGECVYFIQRLTGYFDNCKREDCFKKPFRGYAGKIKPNAKEPAVGRAVLLEYLLGHAALIVGIDGDELVLAEANFHLDWKVQVGRRISISDPHIRGYFAF